ncbi:hypothetical protein CF386_09225 [Paraphotobacterium marinum]|uniref:Uncharacterized protein n=1 Tax=Paraphotobacterium marinum TaxID=1755811 RepID=A0A220VGE5_9GAMM|nr:hypothetical protein [Paraphotobacterium marinum]ASK79242.1 hypothetical protein CF386_09225 [Paraphotobacterium marinum]
MESSNWLNYIFLLILLTMGLTACNKNNNSEQNHVLSDVDYSAQLIQSGDNYEGQAAYLNFKIESQLTQLGLSNHPLSESELISHGAKLCDQFADDFEHKYQKLVNGSFKITDFGFNRDVHNLKNVVTVLSDHFLKEDQNKIYPNQCVLELSTAALVAKTNPQNLSDSILIKTHGALQTSSFELTLIGKVEIKSDNSLLIHLPISPNKVRFHYYDIDIDLGANTGIENLKQSGMNKIDIHDVHYGLKGEKQGDSLQLKDMQLGEGYILNDSKVKKFAEKSQIISSADFDTENKFYSFTLNSNSETQNNILNSSFMDLSISSPPNNEWGKFKGYYEFFYKDSIGTKRKVLIEQK